METKFLFLAIGIAVTAAAIASIQLNLATGQTNEGVVSVENKTGTLEGSEAKESLLGNGTMTSSIPTPVNTTQLQMHIDEAKTRMQSNDTQGALNHVILALEEIETILGGNVTSAANSTDTTMNSTIGPMMP